MPTFSEFLRVAEMTITDKTSSKRMAEIVSILRKHGAHKGLTPEKAVAVLEDLGPTYVKLGQIASNRGDMLPKAYCDAFAKLRANVEPLDFDTIIAEINTSLGHPWEEVFACISPEPLGSASIAQVHRAELLNGAKVAIKVRRPGVVKQVAEDITLMKHALALAEFSSSEHQELMLTLEGFVSELERTTLEEVDFSIEEGNLTRFHRNTELVPGVSSPLPYPEYSFENMLVMEFVEGVPIDCFEELRKQGNNLDELGMRLARNYVEQVCENGFFHADPHPGNIVVRKGELVWIDLGMTGSLNSSERGVVSKVFRGVVSRNSYELKAALLSLSKPIGPVDHGKLLEQMDSLLASYASRDLCDINVGEAFVEIIEVLRSQNLVLSPAFTMLARGFLTLEGVLSGLSPTTNVVEIIAERVNAITITSDDVARKAAEAMQATIDSAKAMNRLPRQVSDTLEMLDHGQLKVNMEMRFPEHIVNVMEVITGRLSLSLISAGLFIGSSILCTTNMEPRWLEVPVLGVLGYVGAFVLSVYVVWRAIRDKRN